MPKKYKMKKEVPKNNSDKLPEETETVQEESVEPQPKMGSEPVETKTETDQPVVEEHANNICYVVDPFHGPQETNMCWCGVESKFGKKPIKTIKKNDLEIYYLDLPEEMKSQIPINKKISRLVGKNVSGPCLVLSRARDVVVSDFN